MSLTPYSVVNKPTHMTTLQERKAQERLARRRNIQEAAREVFADRGFASASIEQIAKRAQLSVGAIYLYFRSKEDLYLSLLEDALTVFDAELTQLRQNLPAGDRLRGAWNTLVAWAGRDAEGARILRALAQPGIKDQLSDAVTATLAGGVNRVLEHLGACIADGIHDGSFRSVNASEAADGAWAMFLGVLDASATAKNLGLARGTFAEQADRAFSLYAGNLSATDTARNEHVARAAIVA